MARLQEVPVSGVPVVTSGQAAPNDTQDSDSIIGVIILWISGLSAADLTRGNKPKWWDGRLEGR